MDSTKQKDPYRVAAGKRAYRKFVKTHPNAKRLLRAAQSKGGKNGSKRDKRRAGRLGHQAMLHKLLAEQTALTVSISKPQNPLKFDQSQIK